MNPTDLTELLILREAIRLKPYRDSKGILHIGIGRNIEQRGISLAEAKYLLANDLADARRDAFCEFAWFTDLDPVRQDVIVALIFNIGLPRFKGFTKAIAAIQDRKYDRAAEEMLDSRWADDVGPDRSHEMAEMMRTGRYPGKPEGAAV